MSKSFYRSGTASYAGGGIIKISLIIVFVLAIAALGIAAIVLPNYTVEKPPVDKTVQAIVVKNDGLISLNADLSKVYVTVKYADGTEAEFSLKEVLPSGLDTTKEQTLDNVILDIGGFQQKVSYKVVSSAKEVNYLAGQGGIIRGDTNQRVFAGYDGTTVVAVPDEGYEFYRWSDGNPNATRIDKKVSRDMTITAAFKKKKYVVVFYYPNGTTASEELVLHNEAATKVPLASEKEMFLYGHVLSGWSEDYTQITQDTNIYPIFQKYATDLYLSFTQSIEGLPLGTVKDLMSYYPKEQSSILRVTANPFRRFLGWTIQTYNGSVFIDRTMPEGETLSYAIGSDNNYVTFSTARTGSTDEYTLTFIPTATTEELYITANFEYETSNITFSTMGTTLSSIELPAGKPIGEVFDVQPALYLDEATRDAYIQSEDCPQYLKTHGYVFKGWYVSGTSINPATGYPEFITNETTFSRPTALIAYWEKKIYSVVFLQGENEDDEFKNLEWYNPITLEKEKYFDNDLSGLVVTVLYQDQLGGCLTGAFPQSTPYKEHHTFLGWYVADSGGAATKELVDKTYKVTRSIRIIPVFEVIQKTLSITIEGSGYVQKVENGIGIGVPGTFRMDAINSYIFRFVPDNGYSMTALTVNGQNFMNQLIKINNNSEEDDSVIIYELVLEAPILQNYSFVVKFSTTELPLTIDNNSTNVQGSIMHDDSGFNSLPIQTVIVTKGQSKRIWIKAPENYKIFSISVGSVPRADIGENTTSYTLVIDNITVAITVAIIYERIELEIDVPNNIQNGTINYENNKSYMGSSPFIAVEANPGYYIKSLIVNGVKVDPYYPGVGLSVSQLESVSGNATRMINNDVRVTYYVLTFDFISSNKKISVEFAPVYYYINVGYEGVGSVNFTRQTVAKNSTVYVTATTSPTYYVYSYTYTNPSANTSIPNYVNEYSIVASGVSQDANIMLQNIERDIFVNFVFKRCKYTVDFSNKDNQNPGEFATLSYLDNEITVTKSLPYTLEMEALTGKQFTIRAIEGYEIESILVQTEQQVRDSQGASLVGEWQDIAFNAKSHTLALDNIETGYSITVICKIASFKVKLWLANALYDYRIDGAPIAYKEVTLNYGQIYAANVSFDSRNLFDANNISVTGTKDTVRASIQSETEIIIEIEGITSNAEIIVLFTPIVDDQQPHSIITKCDEIKGSLTAVQEVNVNGVTIWASIESGQVSDGATIELRTIPVNNNYVLKHLIVNGVIVTPSINGTYRIQNVKTDIYAEAIFVDNVLPLILDLRNVYGMLSSPVTTFIYGDNIPVRIVAATGYNVSYVAIGSRSNQNILDDTILAKFNTIGAERLTEYIIESNNYTFEQLKEGLYVSVEFAPITYSLSVSINGAGGVGQAYEAGIEKINYGSLISIPIEAAENNFISYIRVNGIVYNPFELSKANVNSAIQKCIGGDLPLTITQNTTIEIGFSPNVYRATVVNSWGGTTLVRTAGGIYSDGYDLQLLAGQNLEIYMLADKLQGTHISELYINGDLIRPEYWKLDLYSPNNNRSITYEYKGPNDSGITGNVHIRVVYEINKYSIAVRLKNKSLNFRTVHTSPTSFGTVTLTGQSPITSNAIYDTDSYLMTVQTYSNISHGTPINFSFIANSFEGYKINYDTAAITYYDPNDTTSSEPKVIPLRSLVNGENYILPSLNFDIESVYVEFVKEKLTYSLDSRYESMGSVYLPEVEKNISIEFSNPYLPNNDVIVERINNVEYYEKGLDYVVRCQPGEGYAITSFKISEEEKLSSLRGNNLTGRLLESINVMAVYTITTHRVSYTTNLINENLKFGNLAIYSSDNKLLWEPNIEPKKDILTPEGKVIDVTANYITVTYNTVVKFVATPNYDLYGYKIDYLTIDNSFQYISNPDIENAVEHTVTAQTRSHVSFSIHYYTVAVDFFEGGTGTVTSSASVKWDSNCTVILNIFAGYKLTAILVNGTADAGLLASAKRTTLNDASNQYELSLLNIKADKILTIETERIAYDITFDGGFMESFNVLGFLQDSVTGVVFNADRQDESAYFSKPSAWSGSRALSSSTNANDYKRYVYSGYRYKDSVTIYFMPIDGYKVKNITITMRTLRGVVTTVVNNTDSLILFDNRYGHYYYKINEATGAINVTVNYEIKTYNVTMSTTGRGNITKVELNDYKQPGTVVTIPRTLNHYDLLTIEFTADYGYHLQNLTINGRVITDVQYEKISRVIDGVSKLVYRYTTDTSGDSQVARMIVDSVVINGKTNFAVSAEFEINTFAVRTFINGVETDYDNALSLSLSNTKMEYNSNYTIFQNITEGYSITDITLKNHNNYVINAYLISNPNHSALLKSAQFTFIPQGSYIDYLDYHDYTGSSSMLFVYYNTIINTHTSVLNPYLYEYEQIGNDYVLVSDPNAIPLVTKVTSGGTVNVPAYSLTRTYNNITKDNNAIHNYNVEARFRFFMDPAASENYVFAGYQMFENGNWRYINEGEPGFVLSSSSVSPIGEAILDTLEYTIKSDRIFRAVVYRVYKVTIEVHPEYKWQSGNLSLSNFNMKYMTYANLAATATFAQGMNPNMPTNTITLTDSDGISNASYTYKIYCGARLNLSLTDSKASLNPVTSTSYYDISYNNNGHLVQTQRTYGVLNTVVINSDRLVHAYANNDRMHLDVALETEGEAVGAEGGSVKYYTFNESTGQYISKSISNNALLIPTNTVVKLEITPKTSYRIDGVYQMESQNQAVNGYQVFIPDSWIKLESKLDNTINISKAGDTTIVVMRLIENTVIKIKFWKQMRVTSSVNLLYGNNERTISPSEATGMFSNLKFTHASPNDVYDYEEDISYSVPLIIESDKWNLRYQFIGFFVNGVNSYQQLDSGYPDSNSVNYRLYNYDSVLRPDGVTMVRNSTNENYQVNVVAKYVLLLNITFVNEYTYNSAGGTVYFNPGYFSSDYIPYNPEAPVYYTESSYIWAKGSADEHTDMSIQMYSKINNISAAGDNRDLPTAAYNTWSDNYIMLNWYRSLDENPNAEGFTFIEWQYWAYDGSSWSWKTLPDTNTADQNKPTNTSYKLTVSSLFQNSYLNYQLSGWSLPASMYNEDYEYVETKNIQTIQIRPKFQRKENINIQKIVYTQAYGIPDESAANLGPASIEDNGNTFGTYNYYDIVTLKPGARSGFRFLGWYYSATGLESDYILVSHTDASGPMTAARNYQLVNYQEQGGQVIYGGDLKVRLTKNTIVKAVYIRIWNITVKTYNDSGTTAQMVDSAPILDYYGVAMQVDGQEVYGSPEEVASRTKVMVLQAGEKVKFKLSFAKGNFDSEYDKYYATNVYAGGVLQNWTSTTEALNSINMPIKGESSKDVLQNAELIVVANQQKTVEIVFRSYGKISINNIYPMSSVVLPKGFYDAMVAEHSATNNWTYNSVADNGPIDLDPRVGYILIADIPIKKEVSATYDGVFKNKLPSMSGDYAFMPTNITSFNINFSGAVIGSSYSKMQSFTFYNTTNGGTDGISKMDMPFYVNGSNYGRGTADSPFIISTVNHLRAIDTFIESNGNTASQVYFRLNNNIDVSQLFTGSSPYNGIGKDYPFDGVFDGNNYSMYFSGTIDISQAISSFGIFRKTNFATIRNIKIGQSSNITIRANNSDIVGYLVGSANNTVIEGITTLSGRISIDGRSSVGGIVGKATGNTVIRNCIISCNIGLQAVNTNVGIVGGVVGEMLNTSRVENVNIEGRLQLISARYLGGIAGKVEGDNSIAISNCITYLPGVGENSDQAIGGIVGLLGANRKIEGSSIRSESTALNFISGKFSSFNSSSLSEWETKGVGGGGLIAGINKGTIYQCIISNLPNLTMSGSFVGGIAGINIGTIDKCQSNYVYITTIKESTNTGGVYGAIAGYNSGTITEATINGKNNKAMDFTEINYLVKSLTYANAAFQKEGVNPAQFTPSSDTGSIYVGGFAGYNASGGRIMSSVANSAKMLINRWCANTAANYTYNGIMAGYNVSGNSASTSNRMTNSSAMIYISIAVDNGINLSTGTATMYLYVGDLYGFNQNGSIAQSNSSGNTVNLTAIGIGSIIPVDWLVPSESSFTTNTNPGRNASGYYEGKISYGIVATVSVSTVFRASEIKNLHNLISNDVLRKTNYYGSKWYTVPKTSVVLSKYVGTLRYLAVV